jgi:hypothetical protein
LLLNCVSVGLQICSVQNKRKITVEYTKSLPSQIDLNPKPSKNKDGNGVSLSKMISSLSQEIVHKIKKKSSQF